MTAANRLGARLEILAAAALFSTGAAAIKATDLTAWQVASFRSGLAALTLAAVLWRRGELARLARLRRAPWIGVVYALALTGYVVANKLTTAANTIFLVSTAPVWVAILSPWLLGERPSRRDLALLAVVVAGMAVVFAADTGAADTAPHPALGNRVAAGSALFWALTLIGLRRLGRGGSGERASGGATALAGVVWGNATACLLTLPLALPLAPSAAAVWTDAAAIAYLGIVQIGVAYLLLTAGISRLPAVEVSLLLLLEPVLNPLWAWLLHGEVAAAGALAGGGLIVAALAARVWWGRGAETVRAPPAAPAAGDGGPDVAPPAARRS